MWSDEWARYQPSGDILNKIGAGYTSVFNPYNTSLGGYQVLFGGVDKHGTSNEMWVLTGDMDSGNVDLGTTIVT